jgi:hypothetical protein
MSSHVAVVGTFLSAVWSDNGGNPRPKDRSAAVLLLDNLLRNHSADWSKWVAALLYGLSGNKRASEFVLEWLQGRFLPMANLERSVRDMSGSKDRPMTGQFVQHQHKKSNLRHRLLATTWRGGLQVMAHSRRG